jgi:hypothetical protein
MSPSSFEVGEEEHSDGPICIDDEDVDDGALNQGFAEAMQHQGSGFIIKESLAKPATPGTSPAVDRKTRSKSFDSDESPTGLTQATWQKNSLKPMNLPEHVGTDDNVNNLLSDKSKTPLVVNRELYRAHRSMRLAVLEASKRLEEEQQRRAREEMRKEQAKSNKGAGLIMRHGGELSADAIKQFVAQQQKEEEKKRLDASRRSGRRHTRNRTSSDIRGMFGNTASDLGNRGTLPPNRKETVSAGIPDFNKPLSPRHMAASTTATTSDLPELPKVRNATKPGQFRKTNYDPFSFGVRKSDSGGEEIIAMNGMDSSLHRHLDAGLGLKKKTSKEHPLLKSSGSDTNLNGKTQETVM